MPNLISVESFKNIKNFNDFYPAKYNAMLYFTDAYYDTRKSTWEFDVKKTYPHELYAHVDHVNEDKLFFLELRRFVERRAGGDVIFSTKNMSYKWCWNFDRAKDRYDREYTTISNSYWVFNFETREDLEMWKLMKPYIMTDTLKKYHPDRSGHSEKNCVDINHY